MTTPCPPRKRKGERKAQEDDEPPGKRIRDTAKITISASDPRLESACKEIKRLQEKLQASKEDLRFAEQSVTDLQNENYNLRRAQTSPQIAKGEYLIRISKLEASQRAREKGTNFTTLGANSQEWFGRTSVDQGFRDISDLSRQTWGQRDDNAIIVIPSLVTHDILRELVARCLDIRVDEKKRLEAAVDGLSKLSPEVVLRALITSALAGWVFEADWPQFNDGAMEVLSKYRELIARQDGAVALRNLDLAARAALTNSTPFRKDKIPDKAKALAIKLSQTLAPFFSDDTAATSESDWDGFATWGDETAEWKARRHRFWHLFRVALTTKADLCLNIQNYEMLIYAPGTPFDESTMNAVMGDGRQVSAGKHKGRVVQLCLEAAVFEHKKACLKEDTGSAEAVVSARSFIRTPVGKRREFQAAVKAVVILS